MKAAEMRMERGDEIVIASSESEEGISCWDLQSGAQYPRFRKCSSPPHGLVFLGPNLLASSQLRHPSSPSGSVFYWSWKKPQVEVKSFPAEPIGPLLANTRGSYIIGGALSGHIYFWKVATGALLKKWHAHYRAVTCLVYSDDQSLLISGSEDGCVRVWSLIMMFDDVQTREAGHLYEYSFSEHTLRVTDIVTGSGGCNAIIITASEDRTCKVWSLSTGKLLRNIVFPSIIDAIALDPSERVFYAGGRDGKIYICALHAQGTSNSSYGLHIIGTFSDHSTSITCMAVSLDGSLLVSGSGDGMIRVWDTETHNIIRIFKHAKGPVNNVVVARRPQCLYPATLPNSQPSSGRKHGSLLPRPLEKYTNSMDENIDTNALITPQTNPFNPNDATYVSHSNMLDQINEFQKKGSSGAAEMEAEKSRVERKMVQQWKKMFDNLSEFCVEELLDGDQARGANGPPT